MAEEKQPLTLSKDFSEYVSDSLIKKVTVDILYGIIQLGPPGPPPTRKQRFRWWVEDKKQRARDIWTILKGGDIHENCRDY